MKHKNISYELKHFYPGFDRKKLWNLFVDNEAWSKSDILPGKIVINRPGKSHPQGLGAVRTVVSGSMNITEDIVGFRSFEYFSYSTRNGSLPVLDFGGELFFEEQNNGLLVKYKGSFKPKYFGTGWFFKYFLRTGQKSVLLKLGKAYELMINERSQND